MLAWLHLPQNQSETGLLGPVTLDKASNAGFQRIGSELDKVCSSSPSIQDSTCLRAGMAKLLFANNIDAITMGLRLFPENSFEQVMLAAFIADAHYRAGDATTSLYLWQNYLPWTMRVQRAAAAVTDRNYNLAALLIGHPHLDSVPQSLGERLELVRPIEALAMNSMAVGDAREAESYWRWAIALFPDRAIYYNGLGGALSEQGRWGDAAKSLERAIQLDPNNALHFVGLAQVYLKQGDAAAARQAAEQGLALDPSNQAAKDLLQLLQK